MILTTIRSIYKRHSINLRIIELTCVFISSFFFHYSSRKKPGRYYYYIFFALTKKLIFNLIQFFHLTMKFCNNLVYLSIVFATDSFNFTICVELKFFSVENADIAFEIFLTDSVLHNFNFHLPKNSN